jgi:hypothetical protein
MAIGLPSAAYTHTDYPLEYYFELQAGPGHMALYPGLSDALTKQPYFVVRQA